MGVNNGNTENVIQVKIIIIIIIIIIVIIIIENTL